MLILCMLVSNLDSEIDVNWKSILKQLDHIQQIEQKFDFQIVVLQKQGNLQTTSIPYRKYWTRRSHSLRLEYERKEAPKGRVVCVYNPNYEFKLVRKSPDENWAIDAFFMKQPNQQFPQAIRSSIIEHWVQMFPSTGILNLRPLSLLELAKEPDFRLIRITKHTSSTKASVVAPDQYPDGRRSIYEAEIEFDDQTRGAIKSYTITTSSGNYIEVSIDRNQDPLGEYFPPRQMTCKYFKSKDSKEVILERIVTYEKITPTKYTDRDFTLSAFGLPEPPGEETPGWRINSYLLIAASLAAVATLLFWWLARRKKP